MGEEKSISKSLIQTAPRRGALFCMGNVVF